MKKLAAKLCIGGVLLAMALFEFFGKRGQTYAISHMLFFPPLFSITNCSIFDAQFFKISSFEVFATHNLHLPIPLRLH